MRRAIWAAVTALVLCPSVTYAGGGWASNYPYTGVGNGHWYGAPQGGTPHGWAYGRRLRGGFGCNGYAPVHGPVWGPNAFIPPINDGWVPGVARPHLPRDGFMHDELHGEPLVDPVDMPAAPQPQPPAPAPAPAPVLK